MNRDSDIPEDGDAPAVTEAGASIDPVCGMTMTPIPESPAETYGGKIYHSCSEKCLTKFKAHPWLYASVRAAGQKNAAPANVQYTCPMHPEIVRDAPGACPICGRALEPVVPSDELSHELTDFTRRMWISAAAAVPMIVLTMGPMAGLPVRDWIGHPVAGYLEFVLATPVVFWAAQPFFRRGWNSVVNSSPNIATGLPCPVTGRLLSPMIAAPAMSRSSVSVIINALRLRKVEL